MSLESKSILARLLAEENLSVEVSGAAKTAAFDLKNRRIIIPNWADLSPELYDLLLGHEVGHARHTPTEGWHTSATEKGVAFKGYLNVCEDARIEKKMRRKYPGLRRSFLKGYAELFEKDFFGVQGKNPSTFLLIDKINLLAKLGSAVRIALNDEEQALYEEVLATETWDEVVAVAEKLFAYCKQEQEEKKANPESANDDEDEQDFAPESSDDGESDEDESDDYEDSDSDDGADDGAENSNEFESGESEETEETDEEPEEDLDGPVCQTENAFRKMEESLATLGEVVTLQIPEDILDVVVPVREFIEGFMTEYNLPRMTPKIIAEKTQKFNERNRNAIDQYVKEFQMRKAAASWKKARTSDTGDIDARKLAQYRMTDQIFKARTLLPVDKNHGMILLLDMSSSMQSIIDRAVEQTLVLATVCKRVGIPFRVYGFTDQHNGSGARATLRTKPGDLILSGKVFELLRSDMKPSRYQLAFFLLQAYANAACYRYGYNHNYQNELEVPHDYAMGSTPTVTALAALTKIIPQFRDENKLEKVCLVVCTDGAADPVDKYFGLYDNQKLYPHRISYASKTFHLKLGNKSQRVYHFDFVKHFNQYLRNQLNVEVLGFFMTSMKNQRRSHFLSAFHQLCINKDGTSFYQQGYETFKKEQWVESWYAEYSRFFIVNLDEGKQVEIDNKWTAAKKAKAFSSSNKTKKINRIIATKFMEIAA